jgi:hypothetical protein
MVIPKEGGESSVPAEKAVIRMRDGREDLLISVNLQTAAQEAAWIVPVPARPEVRAGDARVFGYLADLTKEEVRNIPLPVPVPLELLCLAAPFLFLMGGSGSRDTGALPAAGAGVSVLERRNVGIFDVSVRAATEPAALGEWLSENGYQLPPAIAPVLASYVEQGWFYVALRVAPERTATTLRGDLQPLWISFAASETIYPMRLSRLARQPLDVLIYTLADHRMTMAGLDTEYAGRLEPGGLRAEAGHPIREVVDAPYFLTRLHREKLEPATIADDFVGQRAPNDDGYQRIRYETQPFILPIPVIPIGLLVGWLVWWRRRRRRRTAVAAAA